MSHEKVFRSQVVQEHNPVSYKLLCVTYVTRTKMSTCLSLSVCRALLIDRQTPLKRDESLSTSRI